MDPKLFKLGYEKIVETVHTYMWFWAPEVSLNVGQIMKYTIEQCNRVKSVIVIPNFNVLTIPRWLSGDYGMFTKVVGCNTTTCPCCGANLHDLNTKLDYLAQIHRSTNSFKNIFEFNKQKINKSKGYSSSCLFMGESDEIPWEERGLANLERAEDPLHIIETVLRDIIQHLFICSMFDKDQFYIHCGETLHRNNVSKSGMSSSDWRLLFLQYTHTILPSFKDRKYDTPEDNSILVICELIKYVLLGMYTAEEHRTPQIIVAFAVAAFQLPIYLFRRIGESIMRIHLHTLWIHLARSFTRIALRTISSDAFERSNHDTKFRAQFSSHKPESAIVEDKIRAHEEIIAQLAHSITKRSADSKVSKVVEQLEYPDIVLRAEIVQHPVYHAWVVAFLNDSPWQTCKNKVQVSQDTTGAYIFHTATKLSDKLAASPLLAIGPALLSQSLQKQRLEAECASEHCHNRRVSMYCTFRQCKTCCVSHNCCTFENNNEMLRIVDRCLFHQPNRSVSKPTPTPQESTNATNATARIPTTTPPKIYESQVRNAVQFWNVAESNVPSYEQLGNFFSANTL